MTGQHLSGVPVPWTTTPLSPPPLSPEQEVNRALPAAWGHEGGPSCGWLCRMQTLHAGVFGLRSLSLQGGDREVRGLEDSIFTTANVHLVK